MSSQPRAFFALDLGSATTSAALLGHVGGRWRLIAHTAAPAAVDLDSLLRGLVERVRLADPDFLLEIASGREADPLEYVATWPRLVARSSPLRRITVLAGSRRQRRRLEETAMRAGWLVDGGSADESDPVALTRLALSTRTTTVLLGADHVPGSDEKRHLPELAALLAAAARQRPELTVILAGGAAAFEAEFAVTIDTADEEPGASQAAPLTPTTPMATPSPALAKDGQSKLPGSAPEPIAAFDESADPESADPDTAAPVDDAMDEPGTSAETPAEAPVPAAALEASDAPLVEPGPEPTAAALPGLTLPPSPPPTRPIQTHAAAYVLLAPDPEAGRPLGSALQQVLEGLRVVPDDSRIGITRSLASLSYVLDRSMEVVEVGLQGGLRAHCEPIGQGHFTAGSSYALPVTGSFAPPDPTDDVIDGVMAWSTSPVDRHRLMDRLNDVRIVPWGDAEGDGAVFRLAAAKAAMARLVDGTPEINDHPMPELLVAAGGIFASLPPAVVALALADMVRRSGTTSLACDQARLLGPIGVIEDEAERRRLLANLAEEILMPLGSLILPAGIKPGRNAGTMRLKGASSISEIELHPGAIQIVDLPPGRSAKVGIDFRDAVKLGVRGHHFDLDVVGGLGGLLVDLRDIPLRMSDRPDTRRATLEAWQRGMWPEVDE